MKTKLAKQSHESGSVMVFALTVMTVSAILLGSYLMLVQNQTASVARSQNWNSALALTEAGIEDGLAMVNKGAPNIITDPFGWASTSSLSADGWSTMTNGNTSMTRTFASGGSYTVTVDTNSGIPTITASGSVPYVSVPWMYGTNGYAMNSSTQPFVAAGGVNQSTTVTFGRKVQVQTVLVPLFTAAVVTRSNFNMNGNGTTVDSFDSGNTNYSTGGQYDASKRESSGDVGTDSSIVNTIGIGNGNIYGHVMTGPGTVQSAVQMGPNGGIGTVAWQASNSGIQPGYWSGDFNVSIPDVQPPGGAALNLPAPTNGYYVLSNGFYSTVVSPVLPVKITGGAVTLWVQNSFSQGVTITNGGSLVLYVGATNTLIGHSVSIGGNGNINSPGLAKNLQIYGLPSLTSISFQGNAAFAGTIYAPEADMTGGGGGNNTQDTSGAMIVKSVTLNGHWNFHYDEALRNNGPTRGWIAKNWTEKKYP